MIRVPAQFMLQGVPQLADCCQHALTVFGAHLQPNRVALLDMCAFVSLLFCSLPLAGAQHAGTRGLRVALLASGSICCMLAIPTSCWYTDNECLLPIFRG
jgi:hypothetical protein